MRYVSRSFFIFALSSFIVAVFITRGLIQQPGFTDAYYHFNAANRLVSGDGLIDDYLWTYVGAPDSLPAPSHLYWMPFTSLSAALGMFVFNAPGDYASAQMPFTLMFWATTLVAYGLGKYTGKSSRYAWVAGLLTLFSGYFTRFWGMTDTFAPYAIVGSLCLVFIGLALENSHSNHKQRTFILLAGLFGGYGHLTRADGLLLLVVGWAVILWPWDFRNRGVAIQTRAICFMIFTLGYLLAMFPWFIRNMNAIGTPLPTGGTQSIWFSEYDDLFSYPPSAGPQTLFADGWGPILQTRWTAFSANLGTFVAVEGLIVMAPLMLVGLWRRRYDPFWRAFWLYALGLHIAMTLIFPLAGYRGGLFHSVAALVPFWAALGVLGLDDVVDWMTTYRRRWNPTFAKVVFSVSLVLLAIILSYNNAMQGKVGTGVPRLYRALKETLPVAARVMINDPSQLYYYTELGGVVLPNEAPENILEIARQYDVAYLLIERVGSDGFSDAVPAKMRFAADDPPEFLRPIPFDIPNVRLYAIEY